MKRYRVKPGSRIDLAEWDPNDKRAFPVEKAEGHERLSRLNRELEGLQALLYAEHKHKVLIVLQAMDTGGKDGTIRHVFEGVNPQGVRVAGFKKPTPEELSRDFLWRVHKQVPGRGEIVIFNRSHTELGHIILNGTVAEHYASDAVRKERDLSWKKWAKRFDEYLCRLEQLLWPNLIIIGGGASKKYKKFLHQLTVSAEVRPAQLLNEAGIVGAALCATPVLTGTVV